MDSAAISNGFFIDSVWILMNLAWIRDGFLIDFECIPSGFAVASTWTSYWVSVLAAGGYLQGMAGYLS